VVISITNCITYLLTNRIRKELPVPVLNSGKVALTTWVMVRVRVSVRVRVRVQLK